MPKGVINELFTPAEKMRIAEKFRDTHHDLRATKAFVRNVLDVGRLAQPRRRDLDPCMNKSTIKGWALKINEGTAPHDDRRR